MTCGEAPKWHYKGPTVTDKEMATGIDLSHPSLPPLHSIDLGRYRRENVTNVDSPDEENKGRAYFDLGLRHMMSYQHEMASKCFLACLHFSPYCALAHACVSLCHSPNYNFKGEPYYNSTNHPEEFDKEDHLCIFPSQQVSDRHSKRAVEILEELRKLVRKSSAKKKKNGKGRASPLSPELKLCSDQPQVISDVETQLVLAVRILTCHPGVDFDLSDEIVGRPYANALRKIHSRYSDDAEVAYFLAESLMVLNAWQLYEYPTGKPLSDDVVETCDILETALQKHHDHAGLCHMYVHLSEMSSNPGKALKACMPLRSVFPHAGHLIHMPTHIDVLVGDYESCVRWNYAAILADEHSMKYSPDTAGTISFYFGYIVHNYHMLVYGAILGAMETKAMEVATRLNALLNEAMFRENPDLAAYLESYSALEIHVMVRFGRWKEILELEAPEDKYLMLFRAATLKFAKALAYANLGEIELAKKEADRYDTLRSDPSATTRILHNNQVSDLLAVDAPMLRGEIAYREGKYDDAFRLLRKAVELQDGLNFDEPWGKMQPIRHALGGLLLEQGHVTEAEAVFRNDLKFHPNNPWGLVGLIRCLQKKSNGPSCCSGNSNNFEEKEIASLQGQLEQQRKSEWADFNVTVPCLCCSTE